MTKKPSYQELEQRVKELEEESAKHKRVKNALHMSESMLNACEVHTSLIDLNYIYQSVNNAYLKAHNKAREDIVGHSVADLLGKDIFDKPVKVFLDRAFYGENIHYQTWFDFQGIGNRFMVVIYCPFLEKGGTIKGVIVCFRDITEQERIELARKEAEELFTTFAEQFPGPIFLKDSNSRFIFANKHMIDIFGADNWIGKTTDQYHPKKLADRINLDDKRVLAYGPEVIEVTVPDKNGVERHWRMSKFPILRKGKPPIIGAASIEITDIKKLHKELKETHDLLEIKVKKRTAELLEANEGLENEIKERKQIENTLRLEKDNFVNILNSMEDDIYIVDEQYNIEYLNTALRKHFGETQGKKCFEYFNGRKEICPWCRTHEVVEGKTVRWEWHSVKNNKTYDLISTPLKNPNGCISKMQIFRDVTTIKMLRDQLVRSERLAASGQLAASIAHEINSPLQAITFTLSAIKKKFPKEKELEDNIDLLKQEFESIRDTVKNLLDLNRPKQDKKQQININSVIRKTVILVQGRLKKEKVAIDLKLSPRIPDITASPQQLNHVFLNNINNAIEAIAGISRHKEVNIGLKIVKKIDIKSDLKDGNIVINIADNGPGISKDDLEHIFDPFYTRKKIMGLGVGLSICHDIIKDHGGTIMAKNGHNGGAVFTITLPC